MRFHVHADWAKVAEEDHVSDCGDPVKKGDIFYLIYDRGDDDGGLMAVMEVCKECVIVDKCENEA